jgi:nucleotide-binding universal stress UspA family protein
LRLANGQHAPQLLNLAAERLDKNRGSLTVTTKVIEGLPHDVIVQEANDWGADLIVVGSHGYGRVRQALLGSVAAAVAADASCVVEIIRAGRPAVTTRNPRTAAEASAPAMEGRAL